MMIPWTSLLRYAVDRFIKRRFWLLIGLCMVLAALILLLMPAERTIGQVIKIVYLHGALSRAGMTGFIAAGALGFAYLLRRQQVLAWWSQALLASGWGFWTAHFIVSMPATRLTWGPWVAWGEPRVTMTLQVIVAGLLVILVSWLLKEPRLATAAALLFAVAFTLLAARTGVFRHPLDPIGASPSTLLRLVYLLLLIPVIGSMVLVAWRLALSSLLRQELADRELATDHLEA
jgi:heme exporter protein C